MTDKIQKLKDILAMHRNMHTPTVAKQTEVSSPSADDDDDKYYECSFGFPRRESSKKSLKEEKLDINWEPEPDPYDAHKAWIKKKNDAEKLKNNVPHKYPTNFAEHNFILKYFHPYFPSDFDNEKQYDKYLDNLDPRMWNAYVHSIEDKHNAIMHDTWLPPDSKEDSLKQRFTYRDGNLSSYHKPDDGYGNPNHPSSLFKFSGEPITKKYVSDFDNKNDYTAYRQSLSPAERQLHDNYLSSSNNPYHQNTKDVNNFQMKMPSDFDTMKQFSAYTSDAYDKMGYDLYGKINSKVNDHLAKGDFDKLTAKNGHKHQSLETYSNNPNNFKDMRTYNKYVKQLDSASQLDHHNYMADILDSASDGHTYNRAKATTQNGETHPDADPNNPNWKPKLPNQFFDDSEYSSYLNNLNPKQKEKHKAAASQADYDSMKLKNGKHSKLQALSHSALDSLFAKTAKQPVYDSDGDESYRHNDNNHPAYKENVDSYNDDHGVSHDPHRPASYVDDNHRLKSEQWAAFYQGKYEPEHISAIKNYTGSGSYSMNHDLIRSWKSKDKSSLYWKDFSDTHMDKNLSDSMQQTGTPEDAHVYTGISGWHPKMFDKKTGGPLKVMLPAYTSTSLSKKKAYGFSGIPNDPPPIYVTKKDRYTDYNDDDHYKEHGYYPTKTTHEKVDVSHESEHMIRIHVPKGSMGAYVEGVTSTRGEHEFILHRGAKLHVHPKPEIAKIKGYSGDRHLVIWHGKLVHDGVHPTRHAKEYKETKNKLKDEEK